MSDHDSTLAGATEDPVAGPTWTVSAVGTVFFVAIVLGVVAISYTVVHHETAVKVESVPSAAFEALRAEQEARLTGPAHRELRAENKDGSESIVIPVEQAMQAIVAESGGAR